jgi:hypothetical protein
MTFWIAQAVPAVSELTSFGAAGLMGAMWLWERNTNRTREEQLTAVHDRVMGDRIQLDALMEIVQRNTQAMTRLSALIEQNREQNGKEST